MPEEVAVLDASGEPNDIEIRTHRQQQRHGPKTTGHGAGRKHTSRSQRHGAVREQRGHAGRLSERGGRVVRRQTIAPLWYLDGGQPGLLNPAIEIGYAGEDDLIEAAANIL